MKLLNALVLAPMALLVLARSEGFASAEWVEVDASGNIPEGSVAIGCDDESSREKCATPQYVCRGMIEDTFFTGKTGQGWGFCSIERGGQEHQVSPQYVLQGRMNGNARRQKAGATVTADKQGLFTREQLDAAVAAGRQGLFTREQLEAAVAAGKQGSGTHALLRETREELPPGGHFCSRNCREAGRLLCPQPQLYDICHGVSAIFMYSRQGSGDAEDIVQAWSLEEPSMRRRLESTCKDAGVPLPGIRGAIEDAPTGNTGQELASCNIEHRGQEHSSQYGLQGAVNGYAQGEAGETITADMRGSFTREQLDAAVAAGKQGLGTDALLQETRSERPPGQFCSRNCREAGRLQCPQHHLSDICHGVSAMITYSRQGSENAEDIVQAWSLREPSKRQRLESTCKDAGVPLPESVGN